jgi:multicomponent Na+:H+ antiporter subunit D
MEMVVLIPLAGGLLVFLFGGRARALVVTACALGTLAGVARLGFSVWRDGAQRQALGGWEAPLGIGLYADGLSVFMLVMTAVTGVFVTLYSQAWYPATKQASWHESDLFWPLWLFLWAALNALFVSADLFNVYVVLELATLSAVALATISGKIEALRAGLRYLLAALTGSMLYLMGVALTYASFDALDMHLLADVIERGGTASLALTLMTVGLLLKTALFPLHFWLPPAHASAPAPVSAVLSGLVVKGSFFILLRLWFEVFENTVTFAAGQMLGALGAAAIIWGSFQAIRQERLKMIIAHSTVGQIGYLFLLFPLITARTGRELPWLVEAWTGGLYQALSHGLAKAAMFLSAGIIIMAMGTDNMRSMRNIAGRLPVTTFAFGLAGMTLIGLPPSGGFVAKWMLIKAIIASNQWWWLPIVVGGSLLTAGYVLIMLRHTFVSAEKEAMLERVPLLMQVSALLLAMAAIVIGLRVEEPLALLRVGRLFPRGTEWEGGLP